jgi:uracil-DNA glycosylase family 4
MKKPDTCQGCILYHKSIGFEPPQGTGKNGVMIIGENPGSLEFQVQVEKSISRQNYRIKDFAFYNLIQCQPPHEKLENTDYRRSAIDHCKVYLYQAIQKFKPKVLSLQGSLAMQEILRLKNLLPSPKSNAPKRGYVYDVEVGNHKCYAIPTIDPHYIVKGNQHMAGVHMWDLARAVKIAESGEPEDKYNYVLYPTPDDIREFINEASRYAEKKDSLMVADIETLDNTKKLDDHSYADVIQSNISCISFSFKEGHAITIKYNETNHEFIQQLFNLNFTYIGWWNLSFDVPRLMSKSFTFGTSTHIDGMLAFKWLSSDVPKGLGFVSTFFTPFREWKSLSDSKPEFYSCRDSDATFRNISAIKKLIEDI